MTPIPKNWRRIQVIIRESLTASNAYSFTLAIAPKSTWPSQPRKLGKEILDLITETTTADELCQVAPGGHKMIDQ